LVEKEKARNPLIFPSMIAMKLPLPYSLWPVYYMNPNKNKYESSFTLTSSIILTLTSFDVLVWVTMITIFSWHLVIIIIMNNVATIFLVSHNMKHWCVSYCNIDLAFAFKTFNVELFTHHMMKIKTMCQKRPYLELTIIDLHRLSYWGAWGTFNCLCQQGIPYSLHAFI